MFSFSTKIRLRDIAIKIMYEEAYMNIKCDMECYKS